MGKSLFKFVETEHCGIRHQHPQNDGGEDHIQPSSYDEILEDLTPENVKDFDTLAFDTGGKLISLMSLWAIKKDPKYGQRDGSLSLKGYGFVGKEFVRLMDYCFYELGKHIVVVFHAVEEKDGDNTRLRIKVEGQTKNNVWEPMDLGGFVEVYGNDRAIGFSNCERYFGKGTRGIFGIRKVPALSQASPNDFLTKLFAEYIVNALENRQSSADKMARGIVVVLAGRQPACVLRLAAHRFLTPPFYRFSSVSTIIHGRLPRSNRWRQRGQTMRPLWRRAGPLWRASPTPTAPTPPCPRSRPSSTP